MTGLPALSVELAPPAWWARGVALLVVLAAATLMAWVSHVEAAFAVRAAGLATGFAALLAAWSVRRLPVARLHWDGQGWSLAMATMQAVDGRLVVALDAGAWLLLRFDPAVAPRRRRWIAAGRSSVGADWHAVRCAVYSPRPAPGGSSAAAVPHPDE